MHSLANYKKIIDAFPRMKIGVVADLVADIYVYGRPFRLSREAPVIVVRYEGEETVPGGGANTVNNIARLGAKVFPVGVVGEDGPGRQLKGYFEKEGVETGGIFSSRERATVSKTRLLAGDLHASRRQVVRIDREITSTVRPALEDKILGYMEEVNRAVNAWVVSDYGYDIVTPRVLEKVKSFAREKPVVVDSRYRILDFAGVTILAPNEQEAEAASLEMRNSECGVRNSALRDPHSEFEGGLLKIGKTLMDRLNPEALLITRGNRGMMLFEKSGGVEDIPISGPNEVTDVTGAGDTVTALLGLAIPTGANFSQAARLSNYAAGVVVMKNGTATLTREELIAAIQKEMPKSK
ncbi:MAG TPA: bifunctional heptose 7-phosphate kinase/heptose 1-phosphate adenyltransferase [Candidatus Tripitaka californicus]|uniref:bifunctional heptose 7-phosphate kinase/heptose 1-phosphate adenyltransferase n=2 Tax=Candidatus Tripitaka californicus TaxID=3367616 RepID=UPI0040255EC9|nr:carbohydrate kinase [Planctomycetota bacterium]